METKEKNLEQDIEQYLLTTGGYEKGTMDGYDKKHALYMPTLLRFIETTQSKMWKRYLSLYGEDAEKQLYKIFQKNVSDFGLLHVLHHGVKDKGVELRFCYFAPASTKNDDLVAKYNANILTETRQFFYSEENKHSIDMVLSLNGIPIIAIELKNQLTGQSVQNAMNQWKYTRDPKELLFHFDTRVVVYFCVDLYETYMTTQLKGENTSFLPFNQGSNGAGNIGDGGNPENPDGYTTSYLWERVLKRENLLSILQHYISRQTTTSISLVNGKKKESHSTKIIFPRYHQLDVVEKLVAHTRELKDGRSFLVQHSAGSGKSNSIAWLTYQLASLHNAQGDNIFRSVFVITDRRVLNRQLQDTITGFEHQLGQIETITDKDNSSKLRDAITDGKRIIITTLHRFPLIYKELGSHSGKRFAIIVDEAHSSQSGKSAEAVKKALADTDEALREMAAWEEKTEQELLDDMDEMTETLLTQGKHKNLYFYAFTATPKPKTLETFGELRADGSFDAYHHYSMRQAIDEGFIEDVLKYYTTIETSYEIAKAITENPEYEEPPAARAIREYHDNHQHVLEQKVAVMVEKFREVTLKKIGGKAKAMVVSPSRAHAVRYLFIMRDYCKKMGYRDVHPLVAFSGTVEYQGVEYTESKLNTTEEYNITESNLPLYFSSDLYNVLIVADKYQTGFDEPLLHTMFVDKGLRGVKAVQTLSRLNRHCEGKIDTYVLDYVNSTDSIVASFKPFYEETLLSQGVDVNMVYTYKQQLDKFALWTAADEDIVYEIYKQKEQGATDLGKLSSAIKPALERYMQLDEEQHFKARFLVKNFNRFYAYMAQVVRTFDRDLYKSYIFSEFLYKFLPKTPHEKVDLNGKLALINNKLTETFSGSLSLAPTKDDKTLNPEKGGQGNKQETKRDLLTNIIEKINLMYAGQFTEADRVIVETIFDQMQKAGGQLRRQAKNTDANMFAQNIFPKAFEEVAMKCYTEQMDAFSKLFEDTEFYQRVMEEMAKAMYQSFKQKKASTEDVKEPQQQEIRPLIQDSVPASERYKNYLPLYSIRAACGYFGEGEEAEVQGWISAEGIGRLNEDMFVVQAAGNSMEPRIHNGDYCVFEQYKGGSRNGKIVLAQHRGYYDDDNAGAFSIKEYNSTKSADEYGNWQHEFIELRPLNPAYNPISLTPDDIEDFRIIGEFIDTL